MKALLRLVCMSTIVLSCNESTLDHPEFERYFRQYSVEGSFVLYDLQNDAYTYYNLERCKEQFIPASTFKILNSLVALETGVVQDENTVLPWDGVRRAPAAWNQDQDMKAAIKNSTVWFYQELARRIGTKRMQQYVSQARYGNMNIAGGIDMFWLTGQLRISQMEQVQFLVRLYKEDLPFTRHNMEMVKKILVQEETPVYTLRAKTGWGEQDGKNIGWYVGYIEREGNAYFFATNIESENPDESLFPGARTAISRQILQNLGLL